MNCLPIISVDLQWKCFSCTYWKIWAKNHIPNMARKWGLCYVVHPTWLFPSYVPAVV